MKPQEDILAIIQELKHLYPQKDLCSLPYEKDYELLFAVRLAAQCTDERVNQVTPALYAAYPTLEDLAKAEPQDIEPYIHSCGFFRPRQRISFWPLGCWWSSTGAWSPAPWRSC